MEIEQIVALVAVGWLAGALLLMGGSIRRGRQLATELANRHPAVYEKAGRPCPGYLYSVRRDRFAQFVARRQYAQLSDPVLAAEFEAFRKSEARLVISLLFSMALVFGAVLFVRHAA